MENVVIRLMIMETETVAETDLSSFEISVASTFDRKALDKALRDVDIASFFGHSV